MVGFVAHAIKFWDALRQRPLDVAVERDIDRRATNRHDAQSFDTTANYRIGFLVKTGQTVPKA